LLEVAKLTILLDLSPPNMAESELMLSSVAQRIKRDINRRNKEILEKSFKLLYTTETQHNPSHSLVPESERNDYDLEYINTKFNEISLLASAVKEETDVNQKLAKTNTIIFTILDVLTKYENEFEENLLKEVKDFLRFMEANLILYRLKLLGEKSLAPKSNDYASTFNMGIESFNLLAEFVQKYWDIQPISVKKHYESLALKLYGVELEMRSNQNPTFYSNVKEFVQSIRFLIIDKEKLQHKYFAALRNFVTSVEYAINKDFQPTNQTKESNVYDYEEEYLEIDNFYSLVNPTEIREFIDSHQQLLPVLIEIPHKVEQYFSDGRLALKMVYDPEIAERERLLVIIQTKEKPAKAFKILFNFYKRLKVEYPEMDFRNLGIDVSTK